MTPLGRRPALLIGLALILALLAGGCTSTGNSALPQIRMLFIGNSFTFFNDGIDGDLHGLAPRTEVERVAKGGYTLERHLDDRATMGKLAEGGWTYVVVQEQSQYPVLRPASFHNSASRFATAIRKANATPMLMMTWARPDTRGVTTGALRKSATSTAKALGMVLIPAGVAFGKSLAEHPGIILNQSDGHPTPAGTYLAACTVYATVFKVSPVGNTYTAGLDPETAAILQAAAAKAVKL